jgi:hypothetical protein
VTSISAGCVLDWKVSGVPHRPQKVRVARGEDWKRAGSPVTKRNVSAGTVNHATNGAPLVLRHIEQWQLVSCEGTPEVS